MPTFHQQMFSLGTMIMICSDSIKRLIPHLTISTFRTLMSVKMKMSSSSMPPTLATPLHCPNSWHNTTMKARSPLIIQVKFQPLFKLLIFTPSILSVLITQWKLSAINLSTLTISTTLHYHNSWHNPTVKTWIPLILQVQNQPLTKPPEIMSSTPNSTNCFSSFM